MTLALTDVTVTVSDGPETLTILDHLDLSVDRGEVVGLIGASGSGKSTLLAVAGLLRTPTSGSVTIAGVESSALAPKQQTRIRRDHIGFVFQSANLFPALTALEQLEFVAHAAGNRNKASTARARDLLGSVGLADRLGHRPAQLSGGERQRVAIARALMAEPEVLLADEPTAALDDRRGREIMDLLVAQAREHGAATLIVTHNPDQLREASRLLTLHEGRV